MLIGDLSHTCYDQRKVQGCGVVMEIAIPEQLTELPKVISACQPRPPLCRLYLTCMRLTAGWLMLTCVMWGVEPTHRSSIGSQAGFATKDCLGPQEHQCDPRYQFTDRKLEFIAVPHMQTRAFPRVSHKICLLCKTIPGCRIASRT